MCVLDFFLRLSRGHNSNLVFVYYTLQVSFEETPTARWFPELQQLSSSVTYMDMRVVGDQRFTALGCQSGQLMCAVTNIISCGMLYQYSIHCC